MVCHDGTVGGTFTLAGSGGVVIFLMSVRAPPVRRRRKNSYETVMSVSIFHIGLPLDHPLIPIEDRPKLTKRLSDLQQRMRDAGYDYNIIHASPESGLEGFKQKLKTQPCDGVLIGGGVVGNPEMTYFLEQIIDAAHAVAPKAKILFFSHSVDVRVTIERWFGPSSV